VSVFQYPWDTETAAPQPVPAATADPDPSAAKPKRRGRRSAAVLRARTSRAWTTPDWLFHHLTVSGPADSVDNFAAAARGSGVTPWQLDYAAIEEDVFVRAVSQPASHRNLTVEGCRILARQFRERVEMRQARAAALVGHSFVCPFDLHALRPVPSAILPLGPAHPDARAWLAAHWGITDRLRQVAVRDNASTGRRLKRGHAVIGYGFFTDGETPHAAIGHCEKRWPALRFFLQPRPAD
jgi:hypothetical protein